MSRFSYFFLGLVSGALALYTVINFHVLRAHDGYHLVAKQPPRMAEVYVDIRQFSTSDWADHPQLSTALVEANEQKLLGDSANAAIQGGIQQMLPTWPDPSATR